MEQELAAGAVRELLRDMVQPGLVVFDMRDPPGTTGQQYRCAEIAHAQFHDELWLEQFQHGLYDRAMAAPFELFFGTQLLPPDDIYLGIFQ